MRRVIVVTVLAAGALTLAGCTSEASDASSPTSVTSLPPLSPEEYQRRVAAQVEEFQRMHESYAEGAEQLRQAEEAQRQAEEAQRQAAAEQQRQDEEARNRAVAAEKARQAAPFDRSTYEVISDRDLAIVAKGPDGAKGRKLVIHGVVTQFDSATGASQFRATTGGQPQEHFFDYDVNSMITALNPQTAANVVKDDLVTMYVEVMGSQTYTTMLGGTTTVPHFRANLIDITGSIN